VDTHLFHQITQVSAYCPKSSQLLRLLLMNPNLHPPIVSSFLPIRNTLLTLLAYFTTLQCSAEYAPDMDSWLRKTIKKSLKSKKAAKSVADYIAKKNVFQRYLMQTSQATDLISGGVKINALPEKVYAVINHRIAVESHIADIRCKLRFLIENLKKVLNVP
jgi:acetylornithine deacetylase/succinyl-diaminopimelate desuccinylase-like protein